MCPESRAFVAVVQDADGEQETELVMITGGELPVIELTDGTRITCIEPAAQAAASTREAA